MTDAIQVFLDSGEEEAYDPMRDLEERRDSLMILFKDFLLQPTYGRINSLTRQMESYENIFQDAHGLDDAAKDFARRKKLDDIFTKLDRAIRMAWIEPIEPPRWPIDDPPF